MFTTGKPISLIKRQLEDYAITNNLTPFICMQNHHSLIYREEEREMFPTLKVGVLWCSLLRQNVNAVFSISKSPLYRGRRLVEGSWLVRWIPLKQSVEIRTGSSTTFTTLSIFATKPSLAWQEASWKCHPLGKSLQGMLIFKRSPPLIQTFNRVEKIAKERGITMAQVSLAWSMSRDGLYRSSSLLFSPWGYINRNSCTYSRNHLSRQFVWPDS